MAGIRKQKFSSSVENMIGDDDLDTRCEVYVPYRTNEDIINFRIYDNVDVSQIICYEIQNIIHSLNIYLLILKQLLKNKNKLCFIVIGVVEITLRAISCF